MPSAPPVKKAVGKPARVRTAAVAVAVSPISVTDLSANPRNPRKDWTQQQAEAFKQSLREFGDLSGIVFNLTTRQLVGGHKRVDEFRKDPTPKLTRTETLTKQAPDGTVAYGHVQLSDGTRFAYREVKWAKAKESAANLAANKWAAAWDWEGVADLLNEARQGGFDLEVTGFDASEFEPLIAADWSAAQPGDMPTGRDEERVVDGAHLPHHIGLSDAAFGALSAVRKKGKHEDWSATVLALCRK